MRVNEGLVARHVEDVAFLWARRRDTLRTSHLAHAERVQLEARLEAHIEGALVAGESGRGQAVARLAEGPAPGTVFAASVLTLAHAPRSFEGLLATLPHDPDRLAEVASSMGWSALCDIEPLLERWGDGSDEWLLWLALAGFTAHRRSPAGAVARGLRARHPALRAGAAKAARDLGELEHAGALAELLTDADLTVRVQAARALARFGDAAPAVRDVLVSSSESGHPLAHEAVSALVRVAPKEGSSLFLRWVVERKSRPLALWVAETLGTSDLVEALFPWMNDDLLARTAGEAFRTVTGADVASTSLSRSRPRQVEDDPNDDPDDPRVELPMHYLLPFPSVQKVSGWWREHRTRFVPGIRYIDGRPVGGIGGALASEHLAELRTLVRTGRAHHQTLAARAMAQRSPALPVVETHAFATDGHPLPGWDAWQARE